MAHSPLLLQLIVILGCARILGLILRFFGQPMVIGEMVAGLMLGPAVFGAVAQFSATLPLESWQTGLIRRHGRGPPQRLELLARAFVVFGRLVRTFPMFLYELEATVFDSSFRAFLRTQHVI